MQHRIPIVFAALLLAMPLCAQVVWTTASGGNGHTYMLSPNAGTQDQVRNAARGLGGYLASITSQAEKTFILNNLAPTGAPWIGLSDEFQDGSWLWDSGEPLVWTNWCGGNPTNNPPEQAAVWADQQNGCWVDVESSLTASQRRGIIEIPPDTAQWYQQRQYQHLSANGSAAFTSSGLRLTNSGAGAQVGSSFREGLKKVSGGFMSTTTFRVINPIGGGGEGFAWILHADQNQGATALGIGGSGLGYAGIPKSLAVEIDLWDASSSTLNEISVHTFGDIPNSSNEAYSIGRVTPAIDMADGQVHTLRVWWLAETSTLELYLDDLVTPILSIPYDLLDGGSYLNGNSASGISLVNGTEAWVGLTGSAGITQSQTVEVLSHRWNLFQVENSSFDEDSISEGGTLATPTAWVPFNIHSYSFHPLPTELPRSAYQGNNVGSCYSTNLEQLLGEVLKPGRGYELVANFGTLAPGSLAAVIQMRTNLGVVIQGSGPPSTTPGEMQERSARVHLDENDPHAGEAISIRVGGGGGANPRVAIDEVELRFIPGVLRVPGDHATIQDAIVAAVSGQTIVVAAGTYPEDIDTLNKKLTIRANAGPLATELSGNGGSPRVLLNGGSRLVGFSIADAGLSGVMMTNASLESCLLSGTEVHVPPTLETSSIVTCIIAGSPRWGLVITGDSPTARIEGCTIVDNAISALRATGLSANITVVNSILRSPTGTTIEGTATVTYSNVEGGWPGTGNIDADPLFVGPEVGDYRLHPSSPCVDAGRSGSDISATDFEGDPRSCPDMGADELRHDFAHGRLLGREEMTPVELDGQTGNNAHLGVVYLNGFYTVSARRVGGSGNHKLYTFDSSGQLVNTRDQDSSTASSAWGYRDGATDGTYMYFGFEGGIHKIDGNSWVVWSLPSSPAASVLGGTYRALAYDPQGDGGNGSFWTANFNSPILELDRQGNILTQHPNLSGWSIYGLALDPQTGRLWASSSPVDGDIVEIDRVTGQETGVRIRRSTPTGSFSGGLSGVVGASGENSFDLVGLDQASSDRLARYRVHLHSGIDGTRAPILGVGFDGGLLSSSVCTIPPGATTMEIGFYAAGSNGQVDAPMVLVANIFGDTTVEAGFLGIPDFVCPLGNGILNWTTPAPTQPVFILGDGLGVGAALGASVPIGPTTTLHTSFPVPLGGPLPPLRLQALYLEPTAPLAPALVATNELRILGQ